MITERKGLISGCPYYPSFPNHAHISDEDVPDLWQLVEAVGTDKLPTFSYVLLRVLQHMGGNIVRSGELHAAKFVQSEVLLVLANPLLLE